MGCSGKPAFLLLFYSPALWEVRLLFFGAVPLVLKVLYSSDELVPKRYIKNIQYIIYNNIYMFKAHTLLAIRFWSIHLQGDLFICLFVNVFYIFYILKGLLYTMKVTHLFPEKYFSGMNLMNISWILAWLYKTQIWFLCFINQSCGISGNTRDQNL